MEPGGGGVVLGQDSYVLQKINVILLLDLG